MKRYKCIKESYVDENHIFYEKVQKPENYLKIIIDKIVELNKQQYKNLQDIINTLNTNLYHEKIIFKPSSKEPKYNSGIVSAGYQPKTNEILLFYSPKIERAFKIIGKGYDSEYFDIFLENVYDLLGHEIIHRMQYLKDKKKYIGVMSDENRIAYLSKPKEIMAHAWEIVQEFKMFGKNNEAIRMIFKSNRDSENLKWLLFSARLKMYYTSFESTSKTMKLLYKYIYEYTEE